VGQNPTAGTQGLLQQQEAALLLLLLLLLVPLRLLLLLALWLCAVGEQPVCQSCHSEGVLGPPQRAAQGL
jgi:hypothetical protein